MRLGVIGGGTFATRVLEMVQGSGGLWAAGVETVGVWTEDDKLTQAAMEEGIPVYEDLEPEDAKELDLMVAAQNYRRLSHEFWSAPRLETLSYHPSLLPRHRGMDSVRWTIKERDPIAGGTVYWVDDGLDTGPIARQDWCHVDKAWLAHGHDIHAVGAGASALWREQLFPMGVRLLRECIEQIARAGPALPRIEQDERYATQAPPLT